MIRCFLLLIVAMVVLGCENNSKYKPVSTPQREDPIEVTHKDPNIGNEAKKFVIAYKQTNSGVKMVHVKLNDVASFDAIFDTGCAGMLISLQEALSLIKAGTFSEKDRLGKQKSSIANGEIIENDVFNIHEVTLVDIDGHSHTIHDVPVTVVENPEADVLIGNCVIDRLANDFYTIDLQKQVITFQ